MNDQIKDTNPREIIKRFEDNLIQIATPYSTGTGFFLKEYNLIITNEHVIRGNKNAMIAGKTFNKQIVSVLYLDETYDLAFISPPNDHNMSAVSLGDTSTADEGDSIIAIGHPFDLNFTATQGIISNLVHQKDNISYIQHDAALNPGNSGGPLVDKTGNIIGINTFIIQDGHNIGFALTSDNILKCLHDFAKGNGVKGVRCASCRNISFETEQKITNYCTFCGASISMISLIQEYEPYGLCLTVEEMIIALGYNPAICRKGPNSWSLQKGSAIVNISYYEKTGLLVGDVFVCTLPENKINDLYLFLLKQNYLLQGMNFSLKDQDIILSLLIYDQYINSNTLLKLFKQLLAKADEYDNILVEQYGAKWKNQLDQFDKI